MKLIAKRPCSFGGEQFYIGDVIPESLIADPKTQEQLGVITIAGDMGAGEQPDSYLPYNEVISIEVKGDEGMQMELLVTPEEIQQVFAILQMGAAEGVQAITEVQSDNVLILLHASDSRKTIKEAAKKQAGNIISTQGATNAPSADNATTDTNTEGEDA